MFHSSHQKHCPWKLPNILVLPFWNSLCRLDKHFLCPFYSNGTLSFPFGVLILDFSDLSFLPQFCHSAAPLRLKLKNKLEQTYSFSPIWWPPFFVAYSNWDFSLTLWLSTLTFPDPFPVSSASSSSLSRLDVFLASFHMHGLILFFNLRVVASELTDLRLGIGRSMIGSFLTEEDCCYCYISKWLSENYILVQLFGSFTLVASFEMSPSLFTILTRHWAPELPV
jgi:hypothetical protein